MELYHFGTLGMRWGVRRYENPDGTLTEAGKRRYNREVEANKHNRKKKTKEEMQDPNRWVTEDLRGQKKVSEAGANLLRSTSELEKKIKVKEPKPLNVKNMTDQEMRERINRKMLEKQYNDLFNPKRVSKGREIVRDVMDKGAAALSVASSVVGLTLAIRELRGK